MNKTLQGKYAERLEKEKSQYKLKIALITDKNIELQQRIDKAIEWVKKNQYYFPKPTELLEMLEGKENE